MDLLPLPRFPVWFIAALLGGLATLGMTGGCTFKGGPEATTQGGMDEYWQPLPVTIRIAPSTRFLRDEDMPILNARIELMDQMEDSIKSAGVIRFDLFASDEAGRTLGRRFYRWDITMRTLENQREHFDPVTRTYLYRLQLDSETATAGPTVLRVTFMRANDGRRLEAQAPVGWE